MRHGGKICRPEEDAGERESQDFVRSGYEPQIGIDPRIEEIQGNNGPKPAVADAHTGASIIPGIRVGPNEQPLHRWFEGGAATFGATELTSPPPSRASR